MTKDEFLYDYSLDYVIYMLNRYVDENFNNDEVQDSQREIESIQTMSFSKML